MSRKPRFRKGDLVRYEGKTYRVVKRREVTPLAMFQTCDYELKLESTDGRPFGWVAENEVKKIEEGATRERPATGRPRKGPAVGSRTRGEVLPKINQQMRTWDYVAAQKAVPYVRRLLAGLREHYVATWHFQRLATRDPDEPSHRRAVLRHRREGCDILEELKRLGVMPYQSPLRGIALFPFAVSDQRAGQVAERQALWVYRDSREQIDHYILYDDLSTCCELEGYEKLVPEEWKRAGAIPTLDEETTP
jgi:hypothetical protein